MGCALGSNREDSTETRFLVEFLLDALQEFPYHRDPRLELLILVRSGNHRGYSSLDLACYLSRRTGQRVGGMSVGFGLGPLLIHM